MASRNVEGAYARLKGLADSTMGQEYSIEKSFADDFVTILKTLRDNVDDPFSLFDLPSDCFILRPSSPVVRNVLRSRISQLLHYLENVHLASNRVLEIGSVYNLIKDQELKSRCSDLLSAPNHFDRVINQATQVLEERLRTKLPDLQNDIGEVLVGKAINPEPGKSRVIFSDISSEQSGYAALFRGIVGAFRNPAHHRFLAEVSREQSLQICAFIDNLLAALETATFVRRDA